MAAARQGSDIWAPALMAARRERLVRLCAHLTRDPDAAEDLAQETLIEAWRHIARLHDPAGVDRWLAAIARNICRRWQRQRGRDHAHLVPDPSVPEMSPAVAAEDDGDLAVELERHELADLLDKALGLLPPGTRAALIARYIGESPQAEIAARLGMSENAVAVRLHRGKLTLRRMLENEFRDDARALGLLAGEPDGWAETRIWCPHCGKRRLLGRFGRSEHESALETRCPECDLATDTYSTNAQFSAAREIIGGVKTFRPALSRLAAWTNAVYRRWLPERRMPCANCGAWMPLAMRYPMDERPAIRGIRGIYGRCPACGIVASQTFGSFVLCLPEGQRFAREHPRIHMLPMWELESDGVSALAVTYASVAGGSRFTVVSARDTYRVLSINGEPVRG